MLLQSKDSIRSTDTDIMGKIRSATAQQTVGVARRLRWQARRAHNVRVRILLAYSTVDGQTLKICQHLQQRLQALGHAVEVAAIGLPAGPDPVGFDQIVIGASIRYGKHRPEVYRFIETHRAALESKPSAFFSVNVVARKPGKNTPETNPYIRTFRRTTGWVPAVMGVFAGKIDYQRYGLLDRLVIRLIMWLTHGPTNPKTCVEFTDWQAVDRFAQQLGEGVGRDSR
jgi:menaquinone-dependent protoporphyrinogen oxidase